MKTTAICPKCETPITIRDKDSKLPHLFPHSRYVDNGGYEIGKDHSMTPCEGSNSPVSMEN